MFGSNGQEDLTPSGANQPQAEDTIIGSTIKIEGDLVSNGNILVEGEVLGTLKTEKNLTVGHGAKVNADVKASSALVSGEVNGNISVDEKIELSESANITGDIAAKILVIKPGATFNGKCTMTEGINVVSDIAKENIREDEPEDEEEE